MNPDLNAALGMAFGAIVTAALKNGVTEDELSRWLALACGSYAASRKVFDDRPA